MIAKEHPRGRLFLTRVPKSWSAYAVPEWTFDPQKAILWLLPDLAEVEAKSFPGSRVIMQHEAFAA